MRARDPYSTRLRYLSPVGGGFAPDGFSPGREGFVHLVRDCLSHLDDYAYLMSHPLARLVGNSSTAGGSSRALEQAVRDCIGAVRQMPTTNRLRELLDLRYVEGLDATVVQRRLGLSRSAYFRAQQKAVELVSAHLWDRLSKAGRLDGESERVTSITTTGRPLPAPQGSAEVMQPPNNLPVQLTSFVGRERETAEVRRLLGATRLLTLTGTGGCGKTRLAYQSAADCLEEYRDGIWAVELAPLSDPQIVGAVIASTLGLQEQPRQPIVEVLAGYLKPKRLLLILDNCEHLLDACARLADTLLRACPSLAILATSREPLGISGETRYRVPSLSLPDPRQLLPPNELAQYESVRLFFERARAVQFDFALTAANAKAVSEVCLRLDGIPLAIELAAARVGALSVEHIAQHLDDRFRLLTSGSRTAPSRQQTLRATVDWSYDLLSETERLLFRRLAVFAGGWTLEAAEEVCHGASDEVAIERADVLDVLLRLVDRSLVVAEAAVGEERYRLPETIRQYAQGRLLESGEMPLARARHRDWCLDLAKQAEPHLLGFDSSLWMDRLEVEHDNLRAALSCSLESDHQPGLEMASSLLWFWDIRCYFEEGRRWLDEFLAREDGETVARGRALFASGMLAQGRGDYEAQRQLLEQALAISRRLGDELCVCRSAAIVGDRLLAEGSTDQGMSLLAEALTLARRIGDVWATATVSSVYGHLAEASGDLALARALTEERLELDRGAGYSQDTAYALFRLAELAVRDRDWSRARRLVQESLELFREQKHLVGASFGRQLLSCVALQEGDLDTAGVLLSESVSDAGQVGSLAIVGGDVATLAGLIATSSRRFRRAATLLGVSERGRPGGNEWWQTSYGSLRAAAVRTVKAALREETFAQAFTMGQAMTLEEAVEYALQMPEEPEPMPVPEATAEEHAVLQPSAAVPLVGQPNGLTRREVEVLRLLAQGRSNKEIAAALTISDSTVERHVANIFAKIGASSRVEAANYASRHGLGELR